MEFRDLIQTRRSVRAFASAISREDLLTILERAQMAPSWKNRQASRCYAVLDPALAERVRAEALPGFNQKSSQNAALVVTTFEKGVVGFTDGQADNEIGDGWGAYDLGLRDAYLILAARDAGYDTLIMGLRDSARLRALLSIPENEEILSVIAIGRRAEEPVLKPRKALEDVAKIF